MFEMAKWITRELREEKKSTNEFPAPYFVRDFKIKDGLKSATLNVCAVGEGAFYIDGKRIPDSFRPMHPSVYDKTLIYNVYDLTDLLLPGNHRFGAVVGNHRYVMDYSVYTHRGEAVPCLIMQLELNYFSGENEIIVTDNQFFTSPSPILFSCTLCGEVYDVRKELPTWCDFGYFSEMFEKAKIIEGPQGEFRTTVCPPIRQMKKYNPIEIRPSLFDFRITTSGHAKIKITGKWGTEIKLIYGERLTKDGLHPEQDAFVPGAYPEQYNSDIYILDGSKDKELEQIMSFHGVRYVEVIGEYDDISIELISSYTDIPVTSYFSCDCDIINKIHDACVNSMLTCYQGMPLDNPKRDAPWLGDIMLDCENYFQNFDVYNALYEYICCLMDSQHADGYFPTMAPCSFSWCYDRRKLIGPDWGDSAIIHIAYYMYKYTGKTEHIKMAWKSLEKLMDYFKSISEGYLIKKEAVGTGDWSSVKPMGENTVNIMSNVYYYLDAIMMCELAKGINENTVKYKQLGINIKNAFQDKFCNGNKYELSHITEFICSAAVGLLEENKICDIVEKIARNIKENSSITFGVHGIRFFSKLLAEYGYAQLVFDTLIDTEHLGFGKNVSDGLTTLAEHFSYKNIQNLSLNHHFFSTIDAYFYNCLAGINLNGIGFENIVIKPYFVNGINYLKAKMCGISVEYDNEFIKINSPYTFTLVYDSKKEKYNAGAYVFKR